MSVRGSDGISETSQACRQSNTPKILLIGCSGVLLMLVAVGGVGIWLQGADARTAARTSASLRVLSESFSEQRYDAVLEGVEEILSTTGGGVSGSHRSDALKLKGYVLAVRGDADGARRAFHDSLSSRGEAFSLPDNAPPEAVVPFRSASLQFTVDLRKSELTYALASNQFLAAMGTYATTYAEGAAVAIRIARSGEDDATRQLEAAADGAVKFQDLVRDEYGDFTSVGVPKSRQSHRDGVDRCWRGLRYTWDDIEDSLREGAVERLITKEFPRYYATFDEAKSLIIDTDSLKVRVAQAESLQESENALLAVAAGDFEGATVLIARAAARTAPYAALRESTANVLVTKGLIYLNRPDRDEEAAIAAFIESFKARGRVDDMEFLGENLSPHDAEVYEAAKDRYQRSLGR